MGWRVIILLLALCRSALSASGIICSKAPEQKQDKRVLLSPCQEFRAVDKKLRVGRRIKLFYG
ncbi:MAG: hypothetical protein DU429_04540 [Candidatus Tokpelaia sp.]|nr:MAG: hypothetical protein DU430_00530 [Candidatus Tokpelaia sp.]KAA6206901.1 MAG: hypothetical protein DU429_04540 [Candidatus Tokpelaia sp.]KAA6405493.1 hypothetical protein DPQ22_04060 [Candidatus Tokpelaia sp.]